MLFIPGNFPGADGIPAEASFLNPGAYYDSAPNVQPVWATPNEGDVQGAINNSRVAEQMAMDYQPRVVLRTGRPQLPAGDRADAAVELDLR